MLGPLGVRMRVIGGSGGSGGDGGRLVGCCGGTEVFSTDLLKSCSTDLVCASPYEETRFIDGDSGINHSSFMSEVNSSELQKLA
jgi:hypothetical protein